MLSFYGSKSHVIIDILACNGNMVVGGKNKIEFIMSLIKSKIDELDQGKALTYIFIV